MQQSSLALWIFLLTNLLNVYSFYKFLHIFFAKCRFNKVIELLIFLAYYVLNSMLHLMLGNPYVNLIANIIMYFMVAMIYIGTIKSYLFSTVLIFATMIIVESIVVLIVSGSGSEINMIWTFVANSLITLLLVVLLERFKHIKDDLVLSKVQWISLFIFPIGSIIIFYVLVSDITDMKLIISCVLLLTFNIFIFFVYDMVNKEYRKKLEAKLSYQQLKFESDIYQMEKQAYQRQLFMVNSARTDLESLKHDYKNHNISLKTFIQNGNKEEALKYIDNLSFDFIDYGIYSNTGNIAIDSIVNYKIEQAKRKGINVNLTIQIPGSLKITSFDINTILGNLMDNAIEAVELCDKEKVITLQLEMDRGIFYIFITNPYSKQPEIISNEILTTKADKDAHGFGITNVKKVIDKYHGEISLNIHEGQFRVDVMMYCSSES